MMTLFQNRIGLEIGGPSSIFAWSGLPVYKSAARIDNCTFGRHTVWEGGITEGATFCYDEHHAPGNQYIAEATDLARFASSSYDFVLSSHMLEHSANPLLALLEWTRVLKEEGTFVLVVPHKDGTFDHCRPVTTLAHLIQDYTRKTDERDLTHLEEILELHDLSLDPEAGDYDAFRQRSMNNFENRCLHHHVFNTFLAVEVVDFIGLQILAVEVFLPYHILVVARKPMSGQGVKNDGFRGMSRPPVWSSPFPSDHLP